jgi:hypothetical protein
MVLREVECCRLQVVNILAIDGSVANSLCIVVTINA